MTQATQRLDAVRQEMAAQNVDLVALGPGAHMHWLLGWHPHPDERLTLALIGKEKALFVVPSVNAEQAGANAGLPLRQWRDEDGPSAVLAAALRDFETVTTLCLDETMRTDFSLEVMDLLPNVKRLLASDVVGKLRMTKDAAEYEALKASALVNDAAMQEGFAAVKPGMTEKQVAAAIRDHFVEHGADVAFVICASGPNGAYPHHSTGDRVIQSGDSIVMDIGAFLGGYPSDMTRMAAVGRAPEGYEEVHGVVEAALQAAMDAARPGVAAHSVDDAARRVITEAGYGDFFVHRTGHGLGLEVHEPPYLTSSSQTKLRENMVFSIEPGIYIPGRFGVRLEEIVILRTDGPEILSSLSRNLHIAG